MNTRDFMDNYWSYYMELEKRVIETRRYVEFDSANYKTYSMEYLVLLEAICSEIDTVGKIAAGLNNNHFKANKTTNIKHWGYEFQQAFPEYEGKVVAFKGRIEICPYFGWKYEKKSNKKGATTINLKEGYKSPFWWNAYNSVKHQRTSSDTESGAINYKNANLKNVIYALAALFLMERFILEKNFRIQYFNKEFNKSNLFKYDINEIVDDVKY